MSKIQWKPGTMVYPLPAVLVTCGDHESNYNIITVAWTGTICTEPAMTYISLRPTRLSYEIIRRTGEFVINLTTKRLAKAVDFCGVKSGRDVDKFQSLKLTPVTSSRVKCPLIKESPLNIECRVSEIKHLGTHDMFLAQVLAVQAESEFMDSKGAFHFNEAEPICFSHGKYYLLGKCLGNFGFSVRKKKPKKRD